jgi:hypothetical protein
MKIGEKQSVMVAQGYIGRDEGTKEQEEIPSLESHSRLVDG